MADLGVHSLKSAS